ncbi:MAG: UDP-N-acetylglucosamine:undecaprenyl-P N-acetylglucosaminyl 1-P transferase [Candidatus Saganbacteria bacterium]|uniref:UDP-N-acetylglucosamine:undecaprenyl-P N-acetylglucosaminyl 1-P transferase n=1 Tax=Candidatus Saganbacteria bacterium TaxID=2575572 RepID=A0A833L2C3_UNCSA|nr:MAG: UDP-N-acetylglucosamine:undecaprenyl-P N-acetylglucosaminyl 1-P transferase [Candidatus Saganbacteria bacterium]
MGGVAIGLSVFFVLLISGNFTKEYLGIFIAGILFILFGLLDDSKIKIRARYKIWTHLLFSFVFIWLAGIHFSFFRIDWINWLLTASFITFMTNSMNMLDGMDGLVSGIAFLSAGFFAILAFNVGQLDIIFLSLVLMGALLGFLKYNFNPASIFLGESGSTFIGFILAVIAVKLNIYTLWNIALSLGIERLQIISFIVPLIILGIPVFDTYFVFINRFLHDVKFSQPGKDHSHHRIHLMGYSQKATVLTLYGMQIILGSIALAMIKADIMQFFALLSVVFVLFSGFTVFLLKVKVYSEI